MKELSENAERSNRAVMGEITYWRASRSGPGEKI